MSGAAAVAYRRHDDQPPLLDSARAVVWRNVCVDPNYRLLSRTAKLALRAAVFARVGGKGWFVWKRQRHPTSRG